MPLKTLFLNPPSFENFDGGASSRWPATREIESYWYPVWLAYPAGMLEGSRLLDAAPHHVSAKDTIEIGKQYEFLVLFTSTPGFPGDIRLAAKMKEANPNLKIAFVGPHVTTLPERSLQECSEIDFVCRREFDYSTVEYANGTPMSEIRGISYRDESGKVVHNPDRGDVMDLDALPDVTSVYYRDLDVRRYNVPFLLYPFVSLYTTRGCPAQCTFCLWLQTLNLTWSCTSRVTTDYDTLKAQREAGCRLLIVGYESGDPQILKNIKKGATVERARQFTKDT